MPGSVGDSMEKYFNVAYTMLGIAIICASLVVGNSYAVSATVLFISLFAAALFRKHPLSWIFLVSILAANPINWAAAFPCNLIAVSCLILYRPSLLFLLPRWLYLPAVLGLVGFAISGGNWMSGALSILQQTNYMINYLLVPILLLPAIYHHMAEEVDSNVKLKGLLLYLIIPTTFLLLVAYIFGTPIKNIKTDEIYHAMDIRLYKFMNTQVNFTRTHSGFIFGSLICASTSIVIMPVKAIYRLAASLCITVNALLLLTVGSVGSSISSMCGIVAIFACASLRINILKSIVSVIAVVCILFLVWNFAPVKVKDYITLRYEERFVSRGINADDRTILWKRAVDYSMEHPEGVGWSISYGDGSRKMNAHNDYLLYAINYGVVAGFAYALLVLALLLNFLRKAKTIPQDFSLLTVNLAGLGVVIVLLINSMSDHLTANKWYFNILWSIIWFAYFCGRSESLERDDQAV